MFGLGLFYSVERGKCKEPVGLALCPRCHYSLNNGENECQIMGRQERGDAAQTSAQGLKKGENRANGRKQSGGIVLRVVTRGIRLFVSPDAKQNILQL